MQYLSCLTDPYSVLVLDTSVIINLHASGGAARILELLPNPIAITDVVLTELRGEMNPSSEQRELLEDLNRMRLVNIVGLDEHAHEIYLRLVSAQDSLDDGEAATIAFALVNNGIPVIDERKGMRIFQREQPNSVVSTTTDILLHSLILSTCGRDCIADYFYRALTEARMRIPIGARQAVIDLIGLDRALKCNSLPNFNDLNKKHMKP